jgi:hypothetical protein
MVVREHRAIADQEVAKVRDLFQVGGNVRDVTPEMDVVELDVNNVLDPVVVGMQHAAALAAIVAVSVSVAGANERHCPDAAEQDVSVASHHYSPVYDWLQGAEAARSCLHRDDRKRSTCGL